jgi:glycosyltransferase involved in cell wall biosynthesis
MMSFILLRHDKIKIYMKITVGIPVYNRKENIALCIDSVLNQKINSEIDFSVLVVDNNSDDGTKDILKGYEKNPLIDVIYNTKNVGMAGNWTKVFTASKGDYTFLLHSDDLLLPNAIDSVYKFLKQNPECEFGFSQVDIKTNKNVRKNIFSLKNKKTGYVNNNWLLNNYFYKADHPCPPQTWFVKNGIIEKMGGFLEGSMCCDFNMSFKIVASNYKIGYIDKSLTQWVLHDDNTGGGDIRKHKAHLLLAIKDLKNRHKEFSLDLDKIKEAEIWVEKHELLEFLKLGEKQLAKEKIKQLKKHLKPADFKQCLMLTFHYFGINMVKPFYKAKLLLDSV